MKTGSSVRCNAGLLLILLLTVLIVSCEKQEAGIQGIMETPSLDYATAILAEGEIYFTESFAITSKDGLVADRSLENPDFGDYENFSITVQNGQSGKTKVTRMEISVDDNVLVTFRDFKKNASYVTLPLSNLTESSVLHVNLEGSVNRFVIVTITATPKVSTITDVDGNVYRTVKIGDQWWMAKNLRVTKFNDGTAIPEVMGNSDWLNLSADHQPAFSWYDNNPDNKGVYGALYNWTAAGNDKLCPEGWHVPDSYEFLDLCLYIDPDAAIGYFSAIAGGVLKEIGLEHWESPNVGATDLFGFTALPGGYRSAAGEFVDLGTRGSWWLDNGLSSFNMSYIFSNALFSEGGNEFGRSIRCIKDN